MKKNWVLTQAAFDAFLDWLSPDREEAAQKYEKLRRGLIVFFDYRGCDDAETLADEAINRVADKLIQNIEGEKVYNLQFIYGVARHIFLEQCGKRKFSEIDERISAEAEDRAENDRQDCMKTCLKTLDEADRRLIIEYYAVDKETKVREREEISTRYGMNMNNLRVKIKRIRGKLKDCRKKCLQKNNL